MSDSLGGQISKILLPGTLQYLNCSIAALPNLILGQTPTGYFVPFKVNADGSLVTAGSSTVTEVRSTALEASKVLKNSAGSIKQLTVFNSSGSAQFILLMNSTTVPADGAVSLLFPPIPIAAGSIVVIDFPTPLVASTGIAVSNSSTGTFTKTIGSADCAFYAQVI